MKKTVWTQAMKEQNTFERSILEMQNCCPAGMQHCAFAVRQGCSIARFGVRCVNNSDSMKQETRRHYKRNNEHNEQCCMGTRDSGEQKCKPEDRIPCNIRILICRGDYIDQWEIECGYHSGPIEMSKESQRGNHSLCWRPLRTTEAL